MNAGGMDKACKSNESVLLNAREVEVAILIWNELDVSCRLVANGVVIGRNVPSSHE